MTLIELLTACKEAADEKFGAGACYMSAGIEVRADGNKPFSVSEVYVYCDKPTSQIYKATTPKVVLEMFLAGIGAEPTFTPDEIDAMTKTDIDPAADAG